MKRLFILIVLILIAGALTYISDVRLTVSDSDTPSFPVEKSVWDPDRAKMQIKEGALRYIGLKLDNAFLKGNSGNLWKQFKK